MRTDQNIKRIKEKVFQYSEFRKNIIISENKYYISIYNNLYSWDMFRDVWLSPENQGQAKKLKLPGFGKLKIKEKKNGI